jgi:hypothetical protein
LLAQPLVGTQDRGVGRGQDFLAQAIGRFEALVQPAGAVAGGEGRLEVGRAAAAGALLEPDQVAALDAPARGYDDCPICSTPLTSDDPDGRVNRYTARCMRLLAALLLALSVYGCATPPAAPVGTPKHTVERSRAARQEFQRLNPCPANGKAHGACPGYVVDHIVPLACGGPDDPSNMQWQTREEAKAKDRWERAQCQARPAR